MATTDQLAAFINRQRGLLEQKGLAILGLGIVSTDIGLGGKRWGDLRTA